MKKFLIKTGLQIIVKAIVNGHFKNMSYADLEEYGIDDFSLDEESVSVVIDRKVYQ